MVEPLLASGIGRRRVQRAGGARRRCARAVLERMAEYRVAGGGYRLRNLFRVLVAHTP